MWVEISVEIISMGHTNFFIQDGIIVGVRPLGFPLSLYEYFCPTPYTKEISHITPKVPHKQIITHIDCCGPL